MQILLGLALLLPFQFAVALEEQPHLVLRFCQPGVTLATVDPIATAVYPHALTCKKTMAQPNS